MVRQSSSGFTPCSLIKNLSPKPLWMGPLLTVKIHCIFLINKHCSNATFELNTLFLNHQTIDLLEAIHENKVRGVFCF